MKQITRLDQATSVQLLQTAIECIAASQENPEILAITGRGVKGSGIHTGGLTFRVVLERA